jgi:hypothetical protein
MASSILQPHYPKSALGIEADRVSAVALRGAGRKQFSIKQAASVELPPGLIEPSFTEPNISDPSEFAGVLREVTEAAGLLSQKKWSVTLPSTTARTAIISLDTEPASKQELAQVLDWKAEQTFGVPAAQLRLALDKISPDKDGKSRFFITAIKLSVLDDYESQFEALGWRVGLMLPRAVGEANWLLNGAAQGDAMLISGNPDGFTALLLRGSEPTVVRSVTCGPDEVDDEIYRLVMFYNDRFSAGGLLQRLLVVGKSLVPAKIQEIASEALGTPLRTLTPDEVGLDIPGGGLSFDSLAAPAGVAALGF